MADVVNDALCAHPGCNCQPVDGEDYCSPHCETAPEEVICGCGHEQCLTAAGAESIPVN